MNSKDIEPYLLDFFSAQGFPLGKRPMTFLVAYSGGLDSSVLLHALAQLRQEQMESAKKQPDIIPFRLIAAHIDHGWRGFPPEEFQLVQSLSQQLHVPLMYHRVTTPLQKTEQAARDRRYQILSQMAFNLKADALLTAHHEEDQLETVLFRLFRGTGIHGLKGIPQNSLLPGKTDHPPVTLLRPMLAIPHNLIERHSKIHSLKVFTDPSNQDTQYSRNSIRKDILPVIQKRFPHFKESLSRFIDIIDGESSILDELTHQLLSQIEIPQTSNNTRAYPCLEPCQIISTWDTTRFTPLSPPLKRRLIKHLLDSLSIEPSHARVEELLQFICGDQRDESHSALRPLPKSTAEQQYLIQLYQDKLYILSYKSTQSLERGHLVSRLSAQPAQPQDEPKDEPQHIAPLSVPQHPQECAWEGTPWSVRLVSLTEFEQLKLRHHKVLPAIAGVWQIPLNLDSFLDLLPAVTPLVFRMRQPGDRIQPLGMSTPKRLKSLLISRNIPRFHRAHIPVLAAGQRVFWIPGIALSEELRPVDRITHVLQLGADLPPWVPLALPPQKRPANADTEGDEDTKNELSPPKESTVEDASNEVDEPLTELNDAEPADDSPLLIPDGDEGDKLMDEPYSLADSEKMLSITLDD